MLGRLDLLWILHSKEESLNYPIEKRRTHSRPIPQAIILKRAVNIWCLCLPKRKKISNFNHG
jgi:hypothetical protein